MCKTKGNSTTKNIPRPPQNCQPGETSVHGSGPLLLNLKEQSRLPAVQWLRLHAPRAGTMGSIPRTKILHAVQCGKREEKEQIHIAPCFSVREANEKEPRLEVAPGALHAPRWATLRPPTPAEHLLHVGPVVTAGRAPSAGPPSSDCLGARTPGWGLWGAPAPGSTAPARACPTCLQNSSSF